MPSEQGQLKLFGEVGLGYAQLLDDAKNIQKIIGDINTSATELKKAFRNITPSAEMKKTVKEMAKLQKAMGATTKSGIAKHADETKRAMMDLEKAIANVNEKMRGVHASFQARKGALEETSVIKSVDALQKEALAIDKLAPKAMTTANALEVLIKKFRMMKPQDAGYDTAFKKMQDGAVIATREIHRLDKEMQQLQKRLIGLSTKKVEREVVDRLNRRVGEIHRERSQLISKVKQAQNVQPKEFHMDNRSLIFTAAQVALIQKGFRELTQTVGGFEQRSKEVARITGSSAAEMERINRATLAINKNTGFLSEKTQEVEALWARTGKAGKDLITATETTMKGFNVAGFQSAEDAVTSLNAVINQLYDKDASKAPEALDAMVKIADKTAVTNVSDVAEVVSRAGGSMRLMKGSIHDITALASIAMENMKLTGDVLGTQMRSMLTRLQNPANVEKLKQLGITITKIGKDGKESFLPFEQAFDNIVKRIRQFQTAGDELSVSKVGQVVAGQRNNALFQALVKDWEKFDERVALSKSSKGYADLQNEKKMDTYAKKVEQLKASVEELAVSIGQSGLLDVMRTAVEGVRSFVEALQKIPGPVKNILVAFAAITSIKSAMARLGIGTGFDFKNLGNDISMRGLKELATQATVGGASLGQLKKNITGLGQGLSKVGTQLGGFIAGLEGLQLAALGVAGAVAMVAGAVVLEEKRQKENFQQVQEGTEKEKLQQLQAMKREMDELLKDPTATQASTKAYEKLKETAESLAHALGINNKALIESDASMNLFTKNTELRIKLMEQELSLHEEEAKAYAQKRISRAFDGAFGLNGVSIQLHAVERAKQEMQTQLAQLSLMDDGPQKMKLTADVYQNSGYNKELLETARYLQELTQYAQSLGKSLDELAKEHGMTEAFEKLQDYVAHVGDGNGLVNISKDAQDATAKIEELNTAFSELVEEVENFSNKGALMESARQEYDEQGFLSPETVAKLVSKYKELSQYIVAVGDGYKLTAGFGEEQARVMRSQKEAVDELLKTSQDMTKELSKGADQHFHAETLSSVVKGIKSASQETKEEVKNLSEAFHDGQMDVRRYVESLVQSLSSVDFSQLGTKDLKELSQAISLQVQMAFQSLDEAFSKGEISRKEFSKGIDEIRRKILPLYTTMNGLHFSNGMWLNAASQVDDFATALQNLDPYSQQAVENFLGLTDGAHELIDSADGVSQAMQSMGAEVGGFSSVAEEFSRHMQTLSETNQSLWDEIVDTVSKACSMTREEAQEALFHTEELGVSTTQSLGASLMGMAEQIASSLGISVEQAQRMLSALASRVEGLHLSVQARVSSTGKKEVRIGANADGSPVTAIIDEWGLSISGTGRGKSIVNTAAPSASSLVGKVTPSYRRMNQAALRHGVKGVTAFQNSLLRAELDTAIGKRVGGFTKQESQAFERLLDTPRRVLEDADVTRMKRALSQATKRAEQVQKELKRREKKAGDGTSPRGRSGAKREKDIPEELQKRLDDLSHKMDMGEIDGYAFAGAVEELLGKYKKQLTAEGLRKIEKMVLSNRTSGVNKHFEASVEDLESAIKIAQTAIDALHQEQQIFDALGLSKVTSITLHEQKISILSKQVIATEAITRKYAIALEAVEKEMASLDTKSIGYKQTIENLSKAQADLRQKLEQSATGVAKLRLEMAQSAKSIYDAKQAEYDKAVANLEKIQQDLVGYIHQRNDRIRKNTQEAFDARMKAIRKEQQAQEEGYQKEKERLQKQLDDFRRYIQKKIDMLQRSWKDDDYKKELEEKRKQAQEIEKKISELSLDDSYAARARVLGLQKDLAQKKNEIYDFQVRHERDATIEGLQDQLKNHEDAQNEKIKQYDDYTAQRRKQIEEETAALQEAHEQEMRAMEERMNASSVYAEAKQAMLSGHVQDVNGAMVSITDAVMTFYHDAGEGAGILGEKIRQEIQHTMSFLQNSLQQTGLQGLGDRGTLQQRLRLSDAQYQSYLADTANKLGMRLGVDDVEGYVLNKLMWEKASPEERKRLSEANHHIRAGIVARGEKNLDANGGRFGIRDLLPTNALTVGAPGGQFSPIAGMPKDMASEWANAEIAKNLLPKEYANYASAGQNYTRGANSWHFGRYGAGSGSFSSLFGATGHGWKQGIDAANRYASSPHTHREASEGLAFAKDIIAKYSAQMDAGTLPSAEERGVIDRLMAKAKEQDGAIYSQAKRTTPGYRDCSSYVYYAVKNAGLLPHGGRGAFTTANMVPILQSNGFQDLGYVKPSELKRGDILWRKGHTGIYTGNNRYTGAHKPGVAAGESGLFNYTKVLRLPGFRHGGVVSHTGLAMVHGTKSQPEYVFNTPQFQALGKMIASFMPSVRAMDIATAPVGTPTVHVERLVHIEGNVTKETVARVERAGEDIVNKLVHTLAKHGYRR